MNAPNPVDDPIMGEMLEIVVYNTTRLQNARIAVDANVAKALQDAPRRGWIKQLQNQLKQQRRQALKSVPRLNRRTIRDLEKSAIERLKTQYTGWTQRLAEALERLKA